MQAVIEQPLAQIERLALVVDDEPDVRVVAQRMLRRLGFTVYEAASGTEAHQVLDQHGYQLALALIDLTMPGQTGDELATEILSRYPSLRIVLMSGFSQQELPAHLRASGMVSFLAKPFTLSSLTTTVTAALSSHAL
ncbi:response regulator [uncultured Chloroflexus sp.]|nr:response regulator [uncultured Chloroflexus sp.]